MVDTSGSTGYLVQVRQYFPSSDILMWLAEFAKATELYLPLSDLLIEGRCFARQKRVLYYY
jgi:hypothetical protein